jgi:hypothetical protein
MTTTAIEAGAPIHFAATLKALGIHPNIISGLMDCHPDTARTLIRQLAATKAAKQAVLDAFEFYLAESGRVVYRLARIN